MKEYRVTIKVDEQKLIDSSVLHEDEPIEDHIKDVIESSLYARTIYEEGAIEIVDVSYDDYPDENHPAIPDKNNIGPIGMNWDDDDMPPL